MNNKIVDAMGALDEELIAHVDTLRHDPKKKNSYAWVKWVAAAACLCLVAVGLFNTLQRFDYFQGAGCGAILGTIVDGSYYYKVDHSGVWRYSGGNTEKVLSTYWEDDWIVNETGLYYHYGKDIYRVDLDTLDRSKIYSANDGTHIRLVFTQNENIIVTIYDKNARYSYQVLVSGETDDVIEQLTDKIPYDSNTPLYSNLHYQVGERKIELINIGGDERAPNYMPTENGMPLLPEECSVSYLSYQRANGIISFGVQCESKEEPETLILFADGKNVLEPKYIRYGGSIGHTLLYVNSDSPENDGSKGTDIWCYDTDTGERWQLQSDSECVIHDFTNDNHMLYSCVPWGEEQTAWKILYDGDRPVSLQLIKTDITK